jgi:hypothetical protein
MDVYLTGVHLTSVYLKACTTSTLQLCILWACILRALYSYVSCGPAFYRRSSYRRVSLTGIVHFHLADFDFQKIFVYRAGVNIRLVVLPGSTSTFHLGSSSTSTSTEQTQHVSFISALTY